MLYKYNKCIDTFEKLKTVKCPIVGPRCFPHCFINGEPIPEGTSPEEKELVERLVEYMGGIFTKQLRSSVAHLVTGSVMFGKYEAAIETKIPIVTKGWIKAIWEENLKLLSSSV